MTPFRRYKKKKKRNRDGQSDVMKASYQIHQIHPDPSSLLIRVEVGIVQEFRNERKFSLKLDSYGLLCKVVILFN